jgi:phosphoenolpyruvate carboxylase
MKAKKAARKIPATMATQHPDHAGRPYWHSEAFIPAIEETRELFLSLSDLGANEYMWDWEGKLVDESVLERLMAKQFEYFKNNPLGKEKFLTFRLPNLKVETEFRLGRALMGILSAAGLSKQVGMHSPPLFEVILPMTESATEMLSVQEAFSEIASLKHPLNKFDQGSLKHIELIPLFEQVSTIIRSAEILEEYFEIHKKAFGFLPKTLRPFIARSDPALNSGLVPTVVAAKIALSKFKRFEKKYKVELYPIIGVGTLPFRGGLNPLHIQDFIAEYKGIRTATIQSAFRYDFPLKKVKQAIKTLEQELPKHSALSLTQKEEEHLIKLIKPFEAEYQKSVNGLAPLINKVAGFIPRRRERVQHIGLFGYSRGMGKVRLPRAISFTAALYSIGIPPELIGTGRGLKKTIADGNIKLLEKTHVNLKKDLEKAGSFLNKPSLEKLAKTNKIYIGILEDILEIEKYLGHSLKPKTGEEKKHFVIVAKIHQGLKTHKNITPLIEKAAALRRSIG